MTRGAVKVGLAITTLAIAASLTPALARGAGHETIEASFLEMGRPNSFKIEVVSTSHFVHSPAEPAVGLKEREESIVERRFVRIGCVTSCGQKARMWEMPSDYSNSGIFTFGDGNIITIWDNGHVYYIMIFNIHSGLVKKVFEESATGIPAVTPQENGAPRVTLVYSTPDFVRRRTWDWDGKQFRLAACHPRNCPPWR